MLHRFQEKLESTGLIPPGARVLVGYSGGADSTCLLHLLASAGIDVVAAHLHHGQRPEADLELEKCAQFAESLGVPFVSGRADVPRLASETKVGLEEAGRNARYEFFRSASRTTGCHLIATAHTLDDHIETVLLNIVRGTGLTGLQGIPIERQGVIRPLLEFRKFQTRGYCEQLGLWFHDDPSNEDIDFARARVRHIVLPELEKINPSVSSAIHRLSQIAREEDALLNAIAAASLEACELKLNGTLRFLTIDCEVAFDLSALLRNPRAVVVRGLRLAARVLGATFEREGSNQLYEILQRDSGSWTLPGGEVVAEWSAHRLHMRTLNPSSPYRFPLTVPGSTDSLEFGWTLHAMPCKATDFVRAKQSLQVVMDPGQLKGELHFRTAKDGDKLRPLGLGGSKKVSDLFQENRLTLAARRRLPIVCDMVGPVWIPGISLADRVKMTDNSQAGLELSLETHFAH